VTYVYLTSAAINQMANHLWQSTVFAGIMGLLAFVLRSNHARTRYWLWLAASLKFLIPFSLLIALGNQVGSVTGGLVVSKTAAGVVLPVIVEQIGRPFPALTSLPAVLPRVSHASLFPEILLAIWVCGALVTAGYWWRRWRNIGAAVRAASSVEMIAGIPVRSSPASVEPGVFGIFRPVLLLPEGISAHLERCHLQAILAHEICHIRRRDNLAAAAHMLVEAVYWFHPLVWWIGARLVEERERACDEEVLRLGNARETYAESILKTCQFYLESPLACVSGIAGSDLKKRIVRIMTQRPANKLSFPKKLLLAAAGLTAVAAPVAFGVLAAPRVSAQSVAAAGGTHAVFDVASIKPYHGAADLFRINAQPGRFYAAGITLRFLVQFAYHVNESQVSGLPGWADSENYIIEAKQDDSAAEQLRKLSHEEQTAQLGLMLQSLLADRFKLTVHHEMKEQTVYALVVAKNGPKMHESATAPDGPLPANPPGPDDPQPRGSFRMNRGELSAMAQNMDRFVNVLSHQTGRVVINQTGLKSDYDFTLIWTPTGPDGEALPDASGPSLFTALEEQLGLKLESQKAPVDTIVADHVERPTEN